MRTPADDDALSAIRPLHFGNCRRRGLFANDFAVDNGVFVGGSDELPRLIGYGEIDGAEHIPSETIERDLSVRNDFLRGATSRRFIVDVCVEIG